MFVSKRLVVETGNILTSLTKEINKLASTHVRMHAYTTQHITHTVNNMHNNNIQYMEMENSYNSCKCKLT